MSVNATDNRPRSGAGNVSEHSVANHVRDANCNCSGAKRVLVQDMIRLLGQLLSLGPIVGGRVMVGNDERNFLVEQLLHSNPFIGVSL